jgi:hypothetical protein
MSIHNNSVVTTPINLQKPNKTIDESFFLQNPTSQVNPITFGPPRVLNKHKWLNLRKSIQKGDYIRIDIAPIPQNQPKRATLQLSNYLKILRLQPAQGDPTVQVDISRLVTPTNRSSLKKAFPSITWLKTHAILPCALSVVPQEPNPIPKATPDKTKKAPNKRATNRQKTKAIPVMQVTDILDKSSIDIQGMILGNLEYDEFHVDKAHYAHDPRLANHLKAQYSKRAQKIVDAALERSSGKGLFLSLDELQEIALLGPYVTKMKIRTPLTLQIINFLATSFPHIEELDLSHCSNIDSILSSLQNFKNIQKLQLGFSDVTGITFAYLPSSLKELDSSCCLSLKDQAILGLKECALKKLDISETYLKGTYFHILPRTLKEVNCQGCAYLEENTLLRLEGCALEKLNILHTHIQGKYIEKFQNSLRTLGISHCPCYSLNTIMQLQNFQLQELNISEAGTLTVSEYDASPLTPLSPMFFDYFPTTLKRLACLPEESFSAEKYISKLKRFDALQEFSCYSSLPLNPNDYFLPNSLTKCTFIEPPCRGFYSSDNDRIIWTKENGVFVPNRITGWANRRYGKTLFAWP